MLFIKNFNKIFVLFFILFISCGYAWDSAGHRIIALIAYQQLKPAAKQKVDQLSEQLDPGYPPLQRFLYAATLADQLKVNNISVYNNWHFINYPYSKGYPTSSNINVDNLVWAINHNESILENPEASMQQKAVSMSFLVHFVGDAHQPMHCINYFSSHFPHGDQGGNFYTIYDKNITNLHMLWDQGVGLYKKRGIHHLLNNKDVKRFAEKIERQYPPQYFANGVSNLDANTWAKESFNIAKHVAYNIPEGAKPSKQYLQVGQRISSQQLALAGYRLANLLNEIFVK